MSVYSGFSTRQQEHQYNSLLSLLLLTVSKRLVKMYKQEQCNERAFRGVFYRIISGLKNLETSKYMPPKLSENMRSIFDLLQTFEVQENDRQASLMLQSNFFDEINKEANILLTPKQDYLVKDQNKRLNFQIQKLNPLQEVQKNSGMPPHPTFSQDIQERGSDRSKIQEDVNIQQETFTDDQQGFNFQPIQIRSKLQQRGLTDNHPTEASDQRKTAQTYMINKKMNHYTEEGEIKQLPYIKQREIDIPQDLVDRISHSVEANLMQKLLGSIIPNKRRNKSRSKSKNKKLQPAFKQLMQEFENDDPVLNRTFQHPLPYPLLFEKDNNQQKPINFSRGKGHLLSEGNRTRSKFYSSDRK